MYFYTYCLTHFFSATAPIVLDDIDCSLADRFEDCTHRGWGVHDCSISESVGVICNPGPSGTEYFCSYCVLQIILSLTWHSMYMPISHWDSIM